MKPAVGATFAVLMVILTARLIAQETAKAAPAPIPPAPGVRTHNHTDNCRKWVPASAQTVSERVWVPSTRKQAWIPPVYRTEYTSSGNPVQLMVTPGHFETVQEPGSYSTVQRKIEVPGRWVLACGR